MALGGRVMAGEGRMGVVLYKHYGQPCEWDGTSSLASMFGV
jgi:hypothetical protein